MPSKPLTAARTVKDIMTRHPVCVTGDTSARELARILESNEISGCPVIDTQERVIGVVSKTDLLRRAVEGPLGSRHGGFLETLAEGLSDFPPTDNLGNVEDFMSPEPVTAGPDDPIPGVARRMAAERVHRVVVVDKDRQAIGVVTTLDLLKVFPS